MPSTPSFKKRLAEITQRNKRITHEKHQPWPVEKKMELVGYWMATGNLREAADLCEIPYDWAKKFKQKPEWQELEADFRLTENLALSNKISKIIGESLELTLDRLEHGDFIYDQKSGEMRRKPAALRDIHRVAADLLTKREQLNKEKTYDSTHKLSVEDQLKLLAQEMAKWNRKQENTIDLVEVEDAVYEEREAGLQEGASVGTHEEAESSEGPGEPERSSENNGGSGLST